jgi:HEAT repeat protein
MGPSAHTEVQALLEMAQEMDEFRSEVFSALGAIGAGADAAIPILIAALKDPNADTRSAAAGALGKIGKESPTVLVALRETLQDVEPEARFWTAEALARINPRIEAPVAVLEQALVSPTLNAELRHRAQNALARLGRASSEGCP